MAAARRLWNEKKKQTNADLPEIIRLGVQTFIRNPAVISSIMCKVEKKTLLPKTLHRRMTFCHHCSPLVSQICPIGGQLLLTSCASYPNC